MIKVNVKTLHAVREFFPNSLLGLSQSTLQNLQSELDPVPDELKDIEYWQEVDKSPALTETQVYDGTETLTPDLATKTVVVVRGVRDKTAEELAEEKRIANAQQVQELKRKLAESDFRVLPDYQARSGKSDAEMQAFYAQRKDLYDELQALEAKYVVAK